MILKIDQSHMFLFEENSHLPYANLEFDRFHASLPMRSERAMVLYFAGTPLSDAIRWVFERTMEFGVSTVQMRRSDGDRVICYGIRIDDDETAALFRMFCYSG